MSPPRTKCTFSHHSRCIALRLCTLRRWRRSRKTRGIPVGFMIEILLKKTRAGKDKLQRKPGVGGNRFELVVVLGGNLPQLRKPPPRDGHQIMMLDVQPGVERNQVDKPAVVRSCRLIFPGTVEMRNTQYPAEAIRV